MEFKLQNGFLVQYSGDDTEIVIPPEIKRIKSHVFKNNTNLQRVIFQGNTEIGVSAFAGCAQLKEIVLPEGIKVIETGAFRDCAALSEIKLRVS